MKKKRLGEVLLERGYVSEKNLQSALRDQRAKFVHLGELMLERGFVEKKELVTSLSEVSGVPYFDCTSIQIPFTTLALIPQELARRIRAIPVKHEGKDLSVVMSEPQDLPVLDELRFRTGLNIVPSFGFAKEIAAAIEKFYGPEQKSVEKVDVADDQTGMECISSSSQQHNIDAMREMQSELRQKSRTTPAVHIVAGMIKAAALKHASDIHIEPQSNETAVRFRVDGMLRDYQRIPRGLQNTVASRIKILSDMDIAERRNPQDGRFLVRIGGRRLDLRVSTLPTQYGEKVVMRLLEGESPLQGFADLGIPPTMVEELTKMLQLPQGMILVTGPTGSGKSTTLYSALNAVRRPSINIITVEDPVEYAVPGLNQVQVNSKAGLTFASCLRSILRQDPNVIMIGEIRDRETAEIAIKAAQTGHLVLSTLHTNDSASAVTRLLDLGIPGFQIASSLTGIIAQRLIRRLCSCCTVSPAGRDYVSRVLIAGAEVAPENQPFIGGCERCDFSGYRGRIGIYELLKMNDALRVAIRGGGRNEDLRTLARQAGLKLMQEYALERVHDCATTIEEVQRVVPFEAVSIVLCAKCERDLSASFVFCPHCGEKRIGQSALGPLHKSAEAFVQ
jgi:type IV pilus assembly protein PilB